MSSQPNLSFAPNDSAACTCSPCRCTGCPRAQICFPFPSDKAVRLDERVKVLTEELSLVGYALLGARAASPKDGLVGFLEQHCERLHLTITEVKKEIKALTETA